MEKGGRIVGMSLNQSAFLSNGNYQTLVGFLRKQYAGRMGTPTIPERMEGRIQKTVQHFMTEVAKDSVTEVVLQDKKLGGTLQVKFPPVGLCTGSW